MTPLTNIDLHHGDCLEVLRTLPDNSVDSIVTDPPYGLSNTKPAQVADVLKSWVTGDTEAVPAKRGGFMNNDWDSFVPPPAVWQECLRVLKPGGHVAVFAGARTQDLMGLSIRLAGFEIRDTLGWVQGSGFPKGQDLGKAIDKMKGAKREVVGGYVRPDGSGPRDNVVASKYSGTVYRAGGDGNDGFATAPATDEARKWDGWNTQLKPAIEPIILARKPLDGTVAGNVLAHGVGGLNIDACRVATDDNTQRVSNAGTNGDGWGMGKSHHINGGSPAGRFPANVLLDEHAAEAMDQQSGGASRFFPVFRYQAKAPKRERPVIEREDGSKIQHPTVKPVELMEWLVTLITPPGGTVLDPFAGSGTTGAAAALKDYPAILIEQDADYVRLIETRLTADRALTDTEKKD